RDSLPSHEGIRCDGFTSLAFYQSLCTEILKSHRLFMYRRGYCNHSAGESAVVLGTYEASTQGTIDGDVTRLQGQPSLEATTQGHSVEVSAIEPEPEVAPPTIQSKKAKEAKTQSRRDDSDPEKVGVIIPEGGANGKKKPPAKKEEGGSLEKAEEKKENVKPTDNDKLAPTATNTVRAARRLNSTGLDPTQASGGQTIGTTGGTGAASRRRPKAVTGETSSGRPTQTHESKKTDKSKNDQLDFYQKRKKKELEKCQLILTRNKQLIQIPSNREMEHRVIEDESWFHGYLWKGDLDRMLVEDGQFLVRKSDYDGTEAYVISVMAQSEIISLVIKQTTTKHLYWVMNYAFRTVVELIDHHYRYNEPVDEASVYLRIPVFRQDWQFSHDQIEPAMQLGSGNFGTVHAGYLKRHPFDPPVKVAVKTLTLTDDNMTAADKNEFLKEAGLMLAVDHPNLVKLFGLAATRMPIQIVMELCNESLEGKLKNHYHAWMFDVKDGIMKVDEMARYVLDAARGLEYLHSCFIIHRDIAARNVLIRDGQAKISDFGLSVIGALKKVNMKNLPTK
ncbi:hypothetical protein PENTCL1PPCAC_10593, partial [Pristionchus entomophagus]